MSPGLKRAREPFRLRNALTGLVLAGFGVGVWAYSISAVKQDDFDDVDQEARALQRVGTSTSGEQSGKIAANVTTAAELTPFPVEPAPAKLPEVRMTTGILAPVLDRTFPRLLDPARKTWVWGAPPVDKMGRLGDSKSEK